MRNVAERLGKFCLLLCFSLGLFTLERLGKRPCVSPRSTGSLGLFPHLSLRHVRYLVLSHQED